MEKLKQICFYRCPKCHWISPENIPIGTSLMPYPCPICAKRWDNKKKKHIIICEKITMFI